MRDTMITRAAACMSDLRLFATDIVASAPPTTQSSAVVMFKDRSSNQQRDQPVDPWESRPTSSSGLHHSTTATTAHQTVAAVVASVTSNSAYLRMSYSTAPKTEAPITSSGTVTTKIFNAVSSSDSTPIGAIISAALRPVTVKTMTTRPTESHQATVTLPMTTVPGLSLQVPPGSS